MSKKEKLIIIDGYGFVFRAYHSLPPLTNLEGTPVGAVYGFTSMLMKVMSEMESSHIVMVLDSGQKNFRHDIFDEYIANWPEAPEDLKPQFPMVIEATEALNIKILAKEGFEADDIIASLVKQNPETEITIISSDKDLMQLVNGRVKMYDSMRDKLINEEYVFNKFGVYPNQLLDVLSLTGDSSDNVPGVAGIGVKTAALLINEYKTLDQLYDNVSSIKQNKRRETLIENKDKAYISKKLITLDEKCPIDTNLENLKKKEIDTKSLVDFLNKNGFKTLIKKAEKNLISADHSEDSKLKIDIIETELKSISELELLKTDIIENGKLYLFFDFEKPTYQGNNLYLQKIYIGCSKDKSFIINIDNSVNPGELDFSKSNGISLSDFAKIFKDVLARTDILKIAFDFKSLMHELFKIGIELDINSYDDLMIMAYTLDCGLHNHEYQKVVDLHLGEEVKSPYEQIFNLYEVLKKELRQQNLFHFYKKLENKLPKVIGKIEFNGIKLDQASLTKLKSEFEKEIETSKQQIFKKTGEEFNIASPKQLGEILYEKLDYPNPKKTKSGSYVTDSETLEDLSLAGFDVADNILHFRQVSKLKSTYTDALINQINPSTKRIHSFFNLAATSTGRLSSSNPNLQNIPIRSEMGMKIRSCFVAEKGKIFLSADYSQIELRLLAHIAGVETMVKALKTGSDIHTATAMDIFGVTEKEVSSELRRKAKTINFGIIYGISPYGLARRIKVSREDAKKYIETYFEKYPGIKKYMDEAINEARANGFIKTLMGRKIHVPTINSKNFTQKSFAERAAINAPLQGTSSDIIKKAMIKIDQLIYDKFPDVKMILQIHDELIFEMNPKYMENFSKELKIIMEDIIKLSVPLTVNTSQGASWAELH